MCTSKYYSFSPTQISEKLCDTIQSTLTSRNIWNQKMIQSGKYRGFKVNLSGKSQLNIFTYILNKGRIYVEKTKLLKDVKEYTTESVQ